MAYYQNFWFAALLVCSATSHAAVNIIMQEDGNDVVVTGSGSINTFNTATPTSPTLIGQSAIAPSFGLLVSQSSPNENAAAYGITDVPEPFGSGAIWMADVFDGTSFGVVLQASSLSQFPGAVFVPENYELGSPIAFSMRFQNHTLESLGVDAGQYSWRWGADDDGDSVTLCIDAQGVCEAPPQPPVVATAVPSMGFMGLLGLAGLVAAGGVAVTRKRRLH